MGKHHKIIQAFLASALILFSMSSYDNKEFKKVPVYYDMLCFEKGMKHYSYTDYKRPATFITHSKLHYFVVVNVGHCWSS